jgi:hypothetical protein
MLNTTVSIGLHAETKVLCGCKLSRKGRGDQTPVFLGGRKHEAKTFILMQLVITTDILS